MTGNDGHGPCVSLDRLERMLADRLDEAERESVEGHVQDCSACQAELVALTGGDGGPAGDVAFLDQLKRIVSPPPSRPHGRGSAPAGLPSIAGFHLVGVVGRGGMGTVYEAIELALGRQVALKVMARTDVAGSVAVERFRREARSAASLHHTNIVPVFGVGEDASCLYYAMQFIEGEGLDRVIDRCRRAGDAAGDEPTQAADYLLLTPDAATEAASTPLGRIATGDTATASMARPLDGPAPPLAAGPSPSPMTPASGSSMAHGRNREVARVGLQVAQALEYAHRRGILHRDVKPSNILIDTAGTAWVADFGLAKSLAADGEALTQTGDVIGTLRYMAPERFEGRSDVRVDIYALGVTLYELLTLRPLFQEENRARLIHKVMREDPPRPRAIDRGVPRDLETIVLKAIAKEPSARYATAAEMAEDLRRHLAGESILARRAGATERVWRWSRRNPQVASLLAALAMVLAGGFAAMAVLWAKAEAGADSARSSAADARRFATSEARTRDASVLQSAKLELDAGTIWARQRRIGRGLLWMERGLRTAPLEADELLRAGRADMAAWAGAAALPTAALEYPAHYNSMSLGPDGRTLAVGASERLHLRDLDSAAPPRELETRGMGVSGYFSPDGRRIVTSSEFTGLRLWDVATGALLRQLVPEQDFSLSGGFSPDGRRLLAFNNYYGVARVLDLDNGRQVGKVMTHGVGGAYFHLAPDGSRIVSGGDDGRVRLWDAATGEPTGRPLEHGHRVIAEFTPRGDAFLTAHRDQDPGVVRIYDVATVALRAEIPVGSAVLGLAFRPDGRSVLVCENAGSARLHELTAGREVGATIRADAPIGAPWDFRLPPASFSPDGQVVATVHVDNTVRLWDAATGRTIGPILEHDEAVRRVAFRPDGRTLVTATADAVVRTWDVSPAFAGTVLPGDAESQAADLSPDGRTLALVLGGVVRLVDPETGLPVAPPLIHDAAIPTTASPPLLDLPQIRAVKFSPDGKTLATAGYDGFACLWEVATGKLATPRLPHEHWVMALAFSPDGKVLATGCTLNYARLWEVATGRPLSPPLRPEVALPGNEIRWVGFRGDGRVLVASSNLNLLRFWDARDGRLINAGADLPLTSDRHIDLSPDGTTLLVRTGVDTQLWDLAGPRRIGPAFGLYRGGSVFSADGRSVVTLGETSAKLWDVASRTQVGAAMVHPAPSTAAAFRPDGSVVVTGSLDGRVRRWDTATGRPIGPPLEHGPAVERVFVTPDGRTIVAIGGRVTTWPLTYLTSDDPGILRAAAGRISMSTLDGAGDQRPLALPDWRRLTPADGPASTLPDPVAFHDRLAAAYMGERRPEAALWHLDRLIALRPGVWSDHARRSATDQALGHLEEAAADAARAEALGPPDRLRAWRAHLDLAAALAAARAGRWAEAIPPLDRLVEARPRDPAFGRRRLRVLAALRMWKPAEAQSRALLEAGGGSWDLLYEAALLRLEVGDLGGYQDLCAQALGLVDASVQPGLANSASWTCALGPPRGPVGPALIGLARRGTEPPSDPRMTLNTLGAILYRAGLDDPAIEVIAKGMALRGDEGLPQDWAFLAMAHARQGRRADARRYLDHLASWHPSGDASKALEELEIAILRREAERVANPDAGFPANPFGR